MCVCLLGHLELDLMGEQLGHKEDVTLRVLPPDVATKEVVALISIMVQDFCR